MKFIVGLLLGILVAGGIVWYYADQRGDPRAHEARTKVETVAKDVKESAHNAIESLDWNPESIKKELKETGQVIRAKARAAGQAIADATADARATATIKGKLLADQDLSVLTIAVNTTAGRVTLAGTASSPENIRKAMQLALATPGVEEVVSTLQVK